MPKFLMNILKRTYPSSIRVKIFILFIIISILPLLILTTLNYAYSVSIMKDEISKSNMALLVQTEENLDNILEMIEERIWSFVILDMQNYNRYVRDLGGFMRNEPGQALENVKVSIDILQSMADSNKYIDSIYLYSTAENFLITSRRGIKKIENIEDYDWYRKAKEWKGKAGWITTRNAYDFDGGSNKKMVSAALLVKDNLGDELGVLCVNLKSGVISDLTSNIDIGENGYILICDSEGNIINHKNTQYISENMLRYGYINKIAYGDKGFFENIIDGDNYLITFLTSNYTKWKFATVIPDSYIRHKIFNKAAISILICIVCIPVAVMFSFIISNSLYTPIKILKRAMKKASEGDFNTRIDERRKDEFRELNLSFNLMVENIDNTIKELYKTRLLKKEAELKALQSQINPHFLYNTLDSMYWMAKLGKTDELSTMIMSFSKFLKINLSKGRDIIPIKELVDEIEYYLTIQKSRFGDKFETIIDIEKSLYQYSMIKFIMQPLVENAIYHGIERKKGKGYIKVTGRKVDDHAIFFVIDDGVGMNEERLAQVRESIAKDMEDRNFALVNVNKRIKAAYGENYHLDIKSHEGDGTIIKIEIPLIKYQNIEKGESKNV